MCTERDLGKRRLFWSDALACKSLIRTHHESGGERRKKYASPSSLSWRGKARRRKKRRSPSARLTSASRRSKRTDVPPFPARIRRADTQKGYFPPGAVCLFLLFRQDRHGGDDGRREEGFFPPSSHERGDSPLLSTPQKCLCKREENRAEDCEIGRVICFPPHIVWENSSKSPD